MKRYFRTILFILFIASAGIIQSQSFTQQGNKLVGTGAIGNAGQGGTVSVSYDGNTAIIGGSADNGGLGAAWIFVRENSIWKQQGDKIAGIGAVGNSFQGRVSISADGNTAVIGGSGDDEETGAAWIFTRKNGQWMQEGNKLVGTGVSKPYLEAPPPYQGSSVAISADGKTVIVGGAGGFTGASWIYVRQYGVWTQQGSKLVGTGAADIEASQGASVALSADGNTAAVGGPRDDFSRGAVWVFVRQNGVWSQQGSKLMGADYDKVVGSNQGCSVSISADGNTILIGGRNDAASIGAAWVFVRQNGVWTQQGSKLVGSGADGHASQGQSVSLSADGNTAIIGGPWDNNGSGAAWVFTRHNGVWTQLGSKIKGTGAVGNAYQYAVSISGDGNTLIMGGSGDNSGSGAAWVFTRTIQKINISGKVTSATTGKAVENATVYLLNSDGTYVNSVEPAMTNSLGQYCFNNIVYSPSGYKVLLFEPLGYAVDENPKTVPEGLNPVVNFTITETISGNRSRDKSYWKNEIYLNMVESSKSRETLSQMNSYMKSITSHYQRYFPSIFPGFSTLEQWYDILNTPRLATLEELAKAELAAALFNFSSLKVGQYFTATKDNKTASDVLTYASGLIRDSKKLSRAIEILTELNCRVTIRADIVPQSSILYKLSGEETLSFGFDEPKQYELYANYPNPFNPSTTIKYSLPLDGHVSLKVYDITGKEVSILVDELQKKGTYEAQWNAEGLSSGIYFYRIQVNDFIKQNKMILLK